MKPWEETWEARDDEEVWDPASRCTVARETGDASRLIAAAPEMARLLLELRASFPRGYDCIFCSGTDWGGNPEPHHPECRLLEVLRKAGVLESEERGDK